MTSLMATDDVHTIRLEKVDAIGRPTGRIASLAPLLFGLGLATALPPAALQAPPDVVLPTIQADALAILDSADLAVILDRPIIEIGGGRVALGEVDERLVGLVASVNVFRVADGAGAAVLLSLGIVRQDRAVGGATISRLWELACAALAQHAIPGGHLDGLGDDAFLAVYDGTTAQVAWLAGDHLATASVTCLAGDEDRAIAVAHAIAACLDRRLGR
jgi:hypothetical protein